MKNCYNFSKTSIIPCKKSFFYIFIIINLINTKKAFLNQIFNDAASTQESKLESVMEKILEGQQKMIVDFKKQFDYVYIELNGKFEALNTQAKSWIFSFKRFLKS